MADLMLLPAQLTYIGQVVWSGACCIRSIEPFSPSASLIAPWRVGGVWGGG